METSSKYILSLTLMMFKQCLISSLCIWKDYTGIRRDVFVVAYICSLYTSITHFDTKNCTKFPTWSSTFICLKLQVEKKCNSLNTHKSGKLELLHLSYIYSELCVICPTWHLSGEGRDGGWTRLCHVSFKRLEIVRYFYFIFISVPL